MADLVIITDHAYKRGKERLSFSKSAMDRTAEKAYRFGMKHSDTTGRLRKYVDGIAINRKYPGKVMILGTILFVFKGVYLITVYPLPTEFVRTANKISRRLKRQREKDQKETI
jgi:hypothetical protein